MNEEEMNFLEFYELTEAAVSFHEKHYNDLLNSVGDVTTSTTKLKDSIQYEIY